LGTSLATMSSLSGSVAVGQSMGAPSAIRASATMGFSTFAADSDSEPDAPEDISDRGIAVFAARVDGGAGNDRRANKFETAKQKWANTQKRELESQVAAVREQQGDLSVDDGFFSGATDY
jgi:hypothetical protein